VVLLTAKLTPLNAATGATIAAAIIATTAIMPVKPLASTGFFRRHYI